MACILPDIAPWMYILLFEPAAPSFLARCLRFAAAVLAGHSYMPCWQVLLLHASLLPPLFAAGWLATIGMLPGRRIYNLTPPHCFLTLHDSSYTLSSSPFSDQHSHL